MTIEDYTFEEKQNALDKAHEVMNRVDEMNAVQIYATKDMHRRRVRLSTESIDYLIEQAERVPKLELNFKSLQQEWVNTVKEKRRLREALEEVFELSKHDNQSRYLDKCYVVARKALEGTK